MHLHTTTAVFKATLLSPELNGSIECGVAIPPVVDACTKNEVLVLHLLCNSLPLSLCAVLPEHGSNQSYGYGRAPAYTNKSHVGHMTIT